MGGWSCGALFSRSQTLSKETSPRARMTLLTGAEYVSILFTRPAKLRHSAGRMKQAADRLGLGEFVVKRHGVLRRQYVHSDLPFLQKIQCLSRNVKALGHPTREHHHIRTVIE